MEMDDEVMAGEDDCRVGEVSNQDGHGLPIRLPLEYTDSMGATDMRGSGDYGDDGDGGRSVGVDVREPPALVTEGTRNDTTTTARGGCGM